MRWPVHTPSPAGGADTELLEEELAAQSAAAVAAGTSAHGVSGLVSILVLPRIEIVNKDKLVASKGKLITVTGACVRVGWRVQSLLQPALAACSGLLWPEPRAAGCTAAGSRRWLTAARPSCSPSLPHICPLPSAETFGEIPNGSAFAVTTSPTPELDATHLVVGRVVEVRGTAAQRAPPAVPCSLTQRAQLGSCCAHPTPRACLLSPLHNVAGPGCDQGN